MFCFRLASLARYFQPGKSLADTSRVVLDGAAPYPVSVSLAPGTAENATYSIGSIVRIAVTFDKNVTILGGSPVLVLDCTRTREAYFDGGNGSTTIYFQYEVCVHEASCDAGCVPICIIDLRLPCAPNTVVGLSVSQDFRAETENRGPLLHSFVSKTTFLFPSTLPQTSRLQS